RSPMCKCNLPREAQAHAAAALVGRVEGQKDIPPAVPIDAGPIVAHLDMEVAVSIAADAEHDHRVWHLSRHSYGIAQKIEDRLRKQFWVGCNAKAWRVDLQPRVDFPLARAREREAQDFLAPRLGFELAPVDLGSLCELPIALHELQYAFRA